MRGGRTNFRTYACPTAAMCRISFAVSPAARSFAGSRCVTSLTSCREISGGQAREEYTYVHRERIGKAVDERAQLRTIEGHRRLVRGRGLVEAVGVCGWKARGQIVLERGDAVLERCVLLVDEGRVELRGVEREVRLFLEPARHVSRGAQYRRRSAILVV